VKGQSIGEEVHLAEAVVASARAARESKE